MPGPRRAEAAQETSGSAAPTPAPWGGQTCPRCGSPEIYTLGKSIGEEWVHLQLCRHCDADHALVAAIDRVTEAAVDDAEPPASGQASAAGRPAEAGGMEKISVSLPSDLLTRLRQRVPPRGLSAHISEVLERDVRRRSMMDFLATLNDEHGPVDPELLEKVDAEWRESSGR